jgi:hypothetical protein
MQYDETLSVNLPQDAKPGDIFYYRLIKSSDYFHVFMVKETLADGDAIIYHFDHPYMKKNAHVRVDRLSEVLRGRKIGRVILTNPPDPPEKRLERAQEAHERFYTWRYHAVFNNCQHFIHYCCYGVNPIFCSQNNDLIRYSVITLIGGFIVTKLLLK